MRGKDCTTNHNAAAATYADTEGGQCGCSPSPTNLVRVEASGDDIIDDKDAAVTAFPEDDLLPFLLVSVRHGLSSLVPDGGG